MHAVRADGMHHRLASAALLNEIMIMPGVKDMIQVILFHHAAGVNKQVLFLPAPPGKNFTVFSKMNKVGGETIPRTAFSHMGHIPVIVQIVELEGSASRIIIGNKIRAHPILRLIKDPHASPFLLNFI